MKKVLRYNLEFFCSPLWIYNDDITTEIVYIDDWLKRLSCDIIIDKNALKILEENRKKWAITPNHYFREINGQFVLIADIVYLNDLKISNELRIEINELNEIFQSIFNEDYPPNSGFASKEEDDIFTKRLLLSAQNLRKEIAPNYDLEFRG